MSSPKIGWLISKAYLEHERQSMTLCEVLAHKKIPYQLVDLVQDPIWTMGSVDAVMVLGGIRFAREALRKNQIGSQQLIAPLMPMFGSDLHDLRNYLFKMPRADRLNQKVQLKTLFQLTEEPLPDEPIFVKPDQSLKSMDAMVVQPWLWSEWFARVERKMLSPSALFWLSAAIDITDEFRVAVSKSSGIIALSRYMHRGEPADSDCALTSAEDAQLNRMMCDVLQNWSFDDPIVMIDIARTAAGLKIIECNAVSTSGWYGLPLVKMIDAIHESLLMQIEKDSIG